MGLEYRRCECCGGTATFNGDDPGFPYYCHMCIARGFLCLHNMDKHLGAFHYSRRGVHNGGDPATCQVCSNPLDPSLPVVVAHVADPTHLVRFLAGP